jgi:hypothetical protein
MDTRFPLMSTAARFLQAAAAVWIQAESAFDEVGESVVVRGRGVRTFSSVGDASEVEHAPIFERILDGDSKGLRVADKVSSGFKLPDELHAL